MDFNYWRHKNKLGESKKVAGVEAVEAVQEFIGSLPLLTPFLAGLEIGRIVDHFCPMARKIEGGLTHGEVFEVLVCNRLTSPAPLYRIGDWAAHYAFDAMLGIDPLKLNDDRIARMLDAVSEKYEEIQSAIVMRMIEKFGISAKSVHYDLTSLSFEGAYDESEMIKFGYSRDKRPDLKQINLSLDVSSDGAIPLWSRILEGNTSDVTTVVENMENLKKHVKIADYVTIMDRGMVSTENLFSLVKDGVGFICAFPLQKRGVELIKSLSNEDFKDVDYTNSNGKDVIRAAKSSLTFETKSEEEFTVTAWIFESSEKKKRDIKSREKGKEKIIKIFEDISQKLNKRKYASRDYAIQQIEKQLGRKKARKIFWWELSGEDGDLSLTYCLDEEAMQKAEVLDGKYILITDDPNRSPEEVVASYKSQNKVERRFSHLKSHLRITPLFLKKDERLAGLVFVTIVALMIYSLLEYQCRKAGINHTAFMIFERLFGGCSFLKIRFSNGQTIHMGGEPTPFQKEILDALNFPYPGEYL